MSGTQLRVIGYNQYDEIVADSVDGCAFRCEPSHSGYVDAGARSTPAPKPPKDQNNSLVRRHGNQNTRHPPPVADISSTYTSFLIDDQPRPICGIKAIADGLTTDIDPQPSPGPSSEGILTVDQGHMRGIAERLRQSVDPRTTSTISFDVKSRNRSQPTHRSSLQGRRRSQSNKDSRRQNLDIAYASDSQRGMRLDFDLATGRGSNIKIAPDAVLTASHEAISIGLVDPDAIVQKLTVTVTDALGKQP